MGRHAEYAIDVRLGDRVRSFALQPETQGAVIGLDLVPVGLTGGLVVLDSGLGSTSDVVYAVALAGVAMAPGLVDYGTGALFWLHPSEIVAVFD